MSWAQNVSYKGFLQQFSVKERWFLLSAMCCSFLISADYAIVRPVSNSLFLHVYTTASLPYAWLVAIPLNFCAVSLYSHYLPKWGCMKMLLITCGVIASGNLLSALFVQSHPSLSFFLYVWKEVYVMLMFQQLWSVIHTMISTDKAKYLYGILFGMGALGSTVGSAIPALLAVDVGSEGLLFSTVPLYLLLVGAYALLMKHSKKGEQATHFQEERHSSRALWHGCRLIFSSRMLLFILSIVSLMQICSSLIDYQFNTALEQAIPEKDLRTQYMGRMFGLVHLVTLVLQFVGSFLLIRFVGIRNSHILIPVLLCVNAVAYLAFPSFGVIALALMVIKSIDFSVFGVLREMLYIPMKLDEKFRAKAVIDVFAHRASKGVTSLLIVGLQMLFAEVRVLAFLAWGCLALSVLWVVSALYFLRDRQGAKIPERGGFVGSSQ